MPNIYKVKNSPHKWPVPRTRGTLCPRSQHPLHPRTDGNIMTLRMPKCFSAEVINVSYSHFTAATPSCVGEYLKREHVSLFCLREVSFPVTSQSSSHCAPAHIFVMNVLVYQNLSEQVSYTLLLQFVVSVSINNGVVKGVGCALQILSTCQTSFSSASIGDPSYQVRQSVLICPRTWTTCLSMSLPSLSWMHKRPRSFTLPEWHNLWHLSVITSFWREVICTDRILQRSSDVSGSPSRHNKPDISCQISRARQRRPC